MYVIHVYSALTLCACITKDIRSHCRWLWTIVWLLGIEFRISERGWAISPALRCIFLHSFLCSCHTAWLILFILWYSGLNPGFCRAKHMCSTTELLSQAFFFVVFWDSFSVWLLEPFLELTLDQPGLELRNLPGSAFQVPRLKATSASSHSSFYLQHSLVYLYYSLQTWFTVWMIFHLTHPPHLHMGSCILCWEEPSLLCSCRLSSYGGLWWGGLFSEMESQHIRY